MKTKINGIWVIVIGVGAFLLGSLLFRGCKQSPPEVRYIQPNMDSLKATIKPDTIIVAEQVKVIKKIPVYLSDTRTVDSLRAAFEYQRRYYENLIAILEGDDKDFGWEWGSVELPIETSIYADSIETGTYFHKWRIEAEGPISSYTYGILPICPKLAPPILPTLKRHFVGGFVGGQAHEKGWRQVYGASYRYRFARLSVGYLPKLDNSKAAMDVRLGIEIAIK